MLSVRGRTTSPARTVHSIRRGNASSPPSPSTLASPKKDAYHSPIEEVLVVCVFASSGNTPGGGLPGRKSIHRFEPYITMFHAHVPFGSTWNWLPLRLPPMISHL